MKEVREVVWLIGLGPLQSKIPCVVPHRHTQGRWPGVKRRTRTCREPKGLGEDAIPRAFGGANGYGARQTRSCALRRSPLGVREAKNQATWCTTGDRSEHGDLLRECEQRPSGSGFGRSSAKAVTALSPTRLQDGASCAGAHTCTEAVLTCFASVIWLKGALHGASYGASSLRERGLCGYSCASGTRRTTSTG